MNSTLQSEKLPIIYQTTEFNSRNGSEAESFAAAKILLALRSEISWGSREEDNRKIDLKLSFEHPWLKKERVNVLSQVKSGEYYGISLNKGFTLKSTAFTAVKRQAHSIFLIWVDRDTHKSFWAYIHPNSQSDSTDYGLHHTISPATYFDLTRCISRNLNIITGGKGISIRRDYSSLKQKRNNALSKYRSFDLLYCPSLGDIKLTRLGWRHMFRKNRNKHYKESSLDCIPYLDVLLKQKPSEHIVTEVKEWNNNEYDYRYAEHLLKYNQIKLYNGNSRTIICRIIEEIRYPDNWENIAILTQQVERKLTFKTVYHKDRN